MYTEGSTHSAKAEAGNDKCVRRVFAMGTAGSDGPVTTPPSRTLDQNGRRPV